MVIAGSDNESTLFRTLDPKSDYYYTLLISGAGIRTRQND